jgi:hypothetical protein
MLRRFGTSYFVRLHELQDMYQNVLDEPSPLGLRLKKSPSLLDLIQMRLSQANSNAGQSSTDDISAEPSKKKDLKSGASSAGERLKASNFPASALRIGSWEVRKIMLIKYMILPVSAFQQFGVFFLAFLCW